MAELRRVPVGTVSLLVDEGKRTVTRVGEVEILALAVGSAIRALSNICTHQRARINRGHIDPRTMEIKCMVHAGMFSLVTGEATALPCRVPIPLYDVVIEGEEVFALVPWDAGEPAEEGPIVL